MRFNEYLIKSSLDYYSDYQDERDAEIIELTEKIVELEQKLAESDDLDKEHPIFKNGTFLKQADDPSIYYMDQGRKRKIKKFDTYLILKRTQGFLEETPDEEVYILVTEDVSHPPMTPKIRSHSSQFEQKSFTAARTVLLFMLFGR